MGRAMRALSIVMLVIASAFPTSTTAAAATAPFLSLPVGGDPSNELQLTDYVSASDLGQWALNIIDRNPRARLAVADFRTSTGVTQAAMDRAGLSP